MEKFRVKTSVKVEVNDNGDTIDICVADMEYKQRLNGVLESFDKISEELHTPEFRAMSREERTSRMVSGMKTVMRQIDEVFGEGCCRKVFGDIVPAPDYISDFFREINHVLKTYEQQRRQILRERYSENRKGAASDV